MNIYENCLDKSVLLSAYKNIFYFSGKQIINIETQYYFPFPNERIRLKYNGFAVLNVISCKNVSFPRKLKPIKPINISLR